jgi:hypothetical protein
MAIRRKAKKTPTQTTSVSSAQNQFCVGPTEAMILDPAP